MNEIGYILSRKVLTIDFVHRTIERYGTTKPKQQTAGVMSMSENNPFNPFANMDPSKFDLTKMMSEFKLPGIDMETLMETQRKNIEAVTQANKVAVEGMQAIAKRQAEMLRTPCSQTTVQ